MVTEPVEVTTLSNGNFGCFGRFDWLSDRSVPCFRTSYGGGASTRSATEDFCSAIRGKDQLSAARRVMMRSIMGLTLEAGTMALLVMMEKMMVSDLEPTDGSM